MTSDDAQVPRLTYLFPAWNEEAGILTTLDAASESAGQLVEDGQIASAEFVIVDDGSLDDTAKLLAERSIVDPRIVVVKHPVNRGLGAAIRSGLSAATGDVVLYTDADLPFDLVEISKALRIMRQRDSSIVALYRHDRTGEGVRRFVYSYLYNSLIRTVLGVRVRDVNFAGKFLRRDVIDGIALRSEGSFIDAEMIAKAERAGFAVAQFGVDYFPRSRGVSTLSSGSVIAGMLKEMRQLLGEIRAVGPRPVLR